MNIFESLLTTYGAFVIFLRQVSKFDPKPNLNKQVKLIQILHIQHMYCQLPSNCYLVVSISLEVFMHRDSRALVGFNEVCAIDNDVYVGDGEDPIFA